MRCNRGFISGCTGSSPDHQFFSFFFFFFCLCNTLNAPSISSRPVKWVNLGCCSVRPLVCCPCFEFHALEYITHMGPCHSPYIITIKLWSVLLEAWCHSMHICGWLTTTDNAWWLLTMPGGLLKVMVGPLTNIWSVQSKSCLPSLPLNRPHYFCCLNMSQQLMIYAKPVVVFCVWWPISV
jgi:hypothetical protein